MMPPASSSMRPEPASEQFDHRLNMYTLAAGAAGVGLLALAPPAAAEIVYTPANVTISTRTVTSYSLDLAGNGTTEFFLSAVSRQSVDQSGGTSRILAKPAGPSNGVVGYGGEAAALVMGEPVGSGRKFNGELMASLRTFIGTEFTFRGQWADAKDRYLGLKFQIDGQTHYGWARLSLVGRKMVARLTGYAYETTPNIPIAAGKTSGTDAVSPAPEDSSSLRDARSSSLGALALGASSLSIWGRKEPAQTRD